MKVVFTQDVPNVAKAREVKEVANGYARNFLFPKNLAVPATSTELKKLELLLEADARHDARLEQEAKELAEVLDKATVNFKVRTGTGERLYGSVTNADIAKEIKQLLIC